MSTIPEQYTELRNLIDSLCQNEITTGQLERLQILAGSCNDSRTFFLQYRQMHAALQWRFRDEPLRDDIPLFERFIQREKAPAKVIAFPGRSNLTSIFSYQVTGLSLLGILIAGLFWGFWGYLIHTDRERWGHPSLPAERIATVARLQGDADCQWDTTQPVPHSGDEFAVGTTLHLLAGHCELAFHSGSRVVLQGPAEIRLQSSNTAHLQIGKLTANVPPQAVGFTVATPMATVVDLGTEFGVEVDEHQQTDVHVIVGKVQLLPTDEKNGTTLHGETLRAGEARRIAIDSTGTRPKAQAIRYEPQRFIQEVRGAEPRQLYVAGVLPSSEYWERRGAKYLVNNQGLIQGRHVHVAEEAMWHSFDGDVKNVFLIFDLGKPCRLESMKVWNYNEQHLSNYKYHGLKQADIFVSDSARFNPVSRPDAWRLVTADQVFSMAPGKPDYSTPDTVALGNLEARFVALVVKDHFGDQSSTVSAAHDCVGLSEVQFFGQPISPSVEQQRFKKSRAELPKVGESNERIKNASDNK